MTTSTTANSVRLPQWFRQELPDMDRIRSLQSMFREKKLHTVCESARCPNLGQCWGQGVATFMILGETCTRACRFCAVSAGRPGQVDVHEPEEVAESIRRMNLNYAVITSVARDDLEDEGAGHFARTRDAVRKLTPDVKIEFLIPDFSAKQALLQTVTDSRPEVLSHNIETVERLSPKIRPQAEYRRSLKVLDIIKQLDANIFTKSSLMVGLGETKAEVEQAMEDLRRVDCDILTIGQYLAPTQQKRHLPVQEYVHPDTFQKYETLGLSMGFKHVMSGPLVRSSYIADRGYEDCLKHSQRSPGVGA